MQKIAIALSSPFARLLADIFALLQFVLAGLWHAWAAPTNNSHCIVLCHHLPAHQTESKLILLRVPQGSMDHYHQPPSETHAVVKISSRCSSEQVNNSERCHIPAAS